MSLVQATFYQDDLKHFLVRGALYSGTSRLKLSSDTCLEMLVHVHLRQRRLNCDFTAARRSRLTVQT